MRVRVEVRVGEYLDWPRGLDLPFPEIDLPDGGYIVSFEWSCYDGDPTAEGFADPMRMTHPEIQNWIWSARVIVPADAPRGNPGKLT